MSGQIGLAARRAVHGALLAVLSWSAVACATAPSSPLAEASATCGAYTATLSLVRVGSEGQRPPFVDGVRWRATIQGPPTSPSPAPPSSVYELGRPLRASVETFTVRGQRADRLDTFLGEWRGHSPVLVQEGLIRLSESFGPLQEGDWGDMFLSLYPPSAEPLWTPHVSFRLQALPDRLAVGEAWAAAPIGCFASDGQ